MADTYHSRRFLHVTKSDKKLQVITKQVSSAYTILLLMIQGGRNTKIKYQSSVKELPLCYPTWLAGVTHYLPSEEFELTASSLGAHIETHGKLIF